MKINKNKGFTLVELIVVIVILGILGTIGLLNYTEYLGTSRDANRISQLKVMSKGLLTHLTYESLPLPESYIEIKSSANIIGYQGYIGDEVLSIIKYNSEGIDPKDLLPFSYYITKNKKNYQLMAFLEERDYLENKRTSFEFSLNKSFAIDYSERFPKVIGDKLGILTDTDNTPVHEIDTLKTAGFLDIAGTVNTYNAILDDSSILTGDNTKLQYLENNLIAGGVAGSCNILLKKKKNLKGMDGTYIIDPEGNNPYSVYCDMTNHGGGWTYCADENQECSFSGKKYVLYGATPNFNKKEKENGTVCSNGVFGDPYPGVVKKCFYK